MLVTERNLRAFIEVSAALKENEIPGFLRYEERPGGGYNSPEVHGHYHWDPATVRRQPRAFEAAQRTLMQAVPLPSRPLAGLQWYRVGHRSPGPHGLEQ